MAYTQVRPGQSRTEIWKQFCSDTGAAYKPQDSLFGDRIEAFIEGKKATIDSYLEVAGVTYAKFTRLRCLCRNPSGLRCSIHWRDRITTIREAIGLKYTPIGDQRFDRSIVFSAADLHGVRQFLNEEHLRNLLLKQPSIYLTVRDAANSYGFDSPQGVDELYLRVNGAIKDPVRLTELLQLASAIIERLSDILNL
jgi:hypothetical protein